MTDVILMFFSLFLFSFCCRQLMKSLLQPLPILANQRVYALPALRLEKGYKIFSWAVMTFVFLSLLVISFYQVFTQL